METTGLSFAYSVRGWSDGTLEWGRACPVAEKVLKSGTSNLSRTGLNSKQQPRLPRCVLTWIFYARLFTHRESCSTLRILYPVESSVVLLKIMIHLFS